MFGHHDDDNPSQPADDSQIENTTATASEESTTQTTSESSNLAPPTISDQTTSTPTLNDSAEPTISTENMSVPQSLTTSPEPEKQPSEDSVSPAGGFPKRPSFNYQGDPAPSETDDGPPPVNPISQGVNNDELTQELISVRQKALIELAPIVDKLDLPPLEKFHTIMMIIQVSDDESFVKKAYELAHSIPDEKDKAQALLDIVNEVNYFTHQQADGQPAVV
ncbi:MAG TPA: hypothetical protein VLF79_01230 [Candidatus Saccharimonadales bacterium]|nr:hypothetical protein [Candidatus Saccharimonadales bacterium]